MMNNNKHVKPNLLDPLIGKKIVKTLKQPDNDYWAPTKSSAKNFYDVYIKQNIGLVIFIIIILLFLIYRYRSIKMDRQVRELEEYYNQLQQINQPQSNQLNQPNQPNQPNQINQLNPLNPLNSPKQTKPTKLSKSDLNDYANMVLELYNHQKEKMREPVIQPKQSNYAYPMYPYAGTLTPSKTRH